MNLKTGLTYAASFAAAVLIHAGVTTGAGQLLRPSAEQPSPRDTVAQQVTLHLTFQRPQPVRLQPEPPQETRVQAPTVVPEPPPLEPKAEKPELVPAEQRAEAAATEPESRHDEAAVRSAPVPQSSASKRTILPAVRIEKPRPLKPIDAEAIYPLGSRLRGEEGAVRLAVLIGQSGRVGDIRVDRSSGFAALDRAAERAVRRTRFTPATRNGRPVADQITITIHFRLDS